MTTAHPHASLADPRSNGQSQVADQTVDESSISKDIPWHFITCEYPPTCGGVADHSALLAGAIANRDVSVTVWCPGKEASTSAPNVKLEPLPLGFSPRGLFELNRRLNSYSNPKVICIHYVPHGYGYKAMNLFFAAWVYGRSIRGDDVRILFHEVVYPWVQSPLRQNLVAFVTRCMGFLLVRAARCCYITIPAWRRYLRSVGASKKKKISVVPVPSMIPLPKQSDSQTVREELRIDKNAVLIGHFGSYGSHVTHVLEPIVEQILEARPNARLLFLGHGGDEWLCRFRHRHDADGQRMLATGELSSSEVSRHIAACDIMIQPYPDGASFRRTSLMASLQQGKPIVTTIGTLSEPIWSQGAVAASPVGCVESFVEQVCAFVDSPRHRGELGCDAKNLYMAQFTIERVVKTLLAKL
jgi:glycosyltransferase involved in cell wall biosynthesis